MDHPADGVREVVVGRIGRAHGVRGQVSVEVRTDEPERRFSPGQRLRMSPPHGGRTELEVVEARPHSGRLLVSFLEVGDRTVAESLRGTLLLVDLAPDEQPADPDEYYDHQLVGLAVVDGEGGSLGEVSAVVHLPEQDLLSVTRPGADRDGEVLVPFVQAIVTDVSLAQGRIVVQPPAGLFEPVGEPSAPAHSDPDTVTHSVTRTGTQTPTDGAADAGA